MTTRYLVRRYNAEYLEQDETLITDAVVHDILKVLVDQARLIEESTRKVRERMTSGKFHIIQSSVYKINSAGIEFLKAMQRVIDAENTVVASTKRIQEYCNLVAGFQDYAKRSTDTIELYDDFNRMLSAYEDIVNGLHKLETDLHEISTDLAFDRAGDAALHLQKMLHEQAIPAYTRMIDQAPKLRWLALQDQFAQMVAMSRQASDNLDVAAAIGDDAELEVTRVQTTSFVHRRLNVMVESFDPSTTAIQNSFDSVYLLYQTLADTSQLLARQYEYVNRQTIDLRALTDDIDALMAKADHIAIPGQLTKHLPMDRLGKVEMAQIAELPQNERAEAMATLTSSVRADMLEAGTMEPVTRPVTEANRVVVTAADNPAIAVDQDLTTDYHAAVAEFIEKVMVSVDTAKMAHNLEFTTRQARDAVVALYPATAYANPAGFGAFGRPVAAAKVLTDSPIKLHLTGEQFVVVLPHGFQIDFEGNA